MDKIGRRVLVVIVSFLLLGQFTSSSYGATNSSKVLNGFQKYLNDAENSYEVSYAALTNEFKLNVANRESSISNAKRDLLTFNKVKVLKLGDNRNYWGNFNCPTTRPACIDVDKGPKFDIGEITSIRDVVADNPAYLDEIDLIIKLGLIELQTPVEFQRASLTIRNETREIASAKATYSQKSLVLNDTLQEAQKVEPALLAAKRAAKNTKDYDKAFVVALQFEFNRQRLDELANLPFRYIDSLKSLDSAVKVTRISNTADAVAQNYTMAGAMKINAICGKTFINEPEFRSMFTKVAQVYRGITGRSIKS